MTAEQMKQRLQERFDRLRQGSGAQKAKGFGLRFDGWMDGFGRWAWLGLMVLTLVFFPPLGLLVLIWMIWGKEFFGPAPFWRQARHATSTTAAPQTPITGTPITPQPRPDTATPPRAPHDPSAGHLDESLRYVSSFLSTAKTLRETSQAADGAATFTHTAPSGDPATRADLLHEGRVALEQALRHWPRR